MGLKMLILALCLRLALGAYVQSVAKEVITYGIIAYLDPNAVLHWNGTQCSLYKLNNVTIFSYQPKDLFGFAGYSPSLKAIVIAFRGTKPNYFQNLVTDINIIQSDYPKCSGCKVHTGFYQGANHVSTAFIAALKYVTKLYPNAPIYIAGHSLGGALAVLTAPIIKDNFPKNPIAQIITGGKPRVGNKQFAAWYNSIFESYRVVFRNDVVPHVPANGLLSVFVSHKKAAHMSLRNHLSAEERHEQLLTAVYFHEGKEVWYNPDWSKFKICASEDPKCVNSVKSLSYSIKDHPGNNYIQITASATQI